MKKNSKVLVLLFAAIAVIGMSFSACAESTTINTIEDSQSDDKRQEFKKLENQITGKIVSIDSVNVVIEVTERKQMKKLSNGTKDEKITDDTHGEKPAEGMQKEKSNMDEMFTLTGENKTINIASADFGKKFEKSNDTTNDNNNQKDTGVVKTYADYQIGDYVTIECTDATYQVAKTMHGGRVMGGGMRGGFGNKEKR